MAESDGTLEADDLVNNESVESEKQQAEFSEPETLDLTWVGSIQEGLKGINEKIDGLNNPTDRRLSQAKGLILILSGITGIVMIASITFFIVMAISISQKVAELDRVLMAVAKRGIQLGDGIETIVEMETKLVEVIEQNNPIPSSLANIESQLFTHGQALIEKEAETRTVLRNQTESIKTQQNNIKDELGSEFDGLERRVNELVNLKPLAKEHSEIKKQLESLNQAVLNMELSLIHI